MSSVATASPFDIDGVPDVLEFEEACAVLRVRRDLMFKLMKRGLPSHKLGRRRLFVKSELIDFVRSRPE